MLRHIVFNPCFRHLILKAIKSSRPRQNYIKILILHNIGFKERKLFLQTIQLISKNYGFAAPADLKEYFQGRLRIESIRILLSFDDGFKSQKIVADDVLNQFGIKVLFFVSPSFVSTNSHQKQKIPMTKNMKNGSLGCSDVPREMQLMDWDDLKSLVKAGHTIGAHTLNHVALSEIEDEEQLRREIIGSGDLLEKKLGIKVEWFTYPFGDNRSISSRAYKIIRERYRFCCTGLRGKNTPETHPYYLCRDHIDLNAPLHYIRFILEGGLDFYYSRRMKQLKRLTGSLRCHY